MTGNSRPTPKEPLDKSISAVVINYRTPDLLKTAVESFRRFYPEIPLLIVDNGSADDSSSAIEQLCAAGGGRVQAEYLPENIFHGPAMHLALQRQTTRYVYVFDSDTETLKGGFLESMHGALEKSEESYGAGHVVRANHRGFADTKGIPVLASAYMLLKRDVYLQLPPFIHHGLPALQNFQAAAKQGYRLIPYPIEEYVEHLGRGTAERYGYGLGLRSKIDYLLNRIGF